MSDISNVTKGNEYCLQWTDRVVAEFFAQGELEAKLRLPVTPFMDRKKACIPKQQLGFYNFVVRPMYEAMDGLISMTAALSNLESMTEHWTSRLPKEETADGGGPQAPGPTRSPSSNSGVPISAQSPTSPPVPSSINPPPAPSPTPCATLPLSTTPNASGSFMQRLSSRVSSRLSVAAVVGHDKAGATPS